MPKPFKGNRYYEWQIGPIVIQVRHNASSPSEGIDTRKYGKKFNVWYDKYWR